MKTLKIALVITLITFFVSAGYIRAQTYEFEWRLDFNGSEVFCLNHPVDGYMIYHVTLHVNQKTGLIDRCHNNVKEYKLTDLITEETLTIIDTGNDNIGWWWGFWNGVSGAGLALPAEGEFPNEGKAVGTFKVISQGGNVYSGIILFQLHRDASGNITVEKYREIWDCN